MKSKVTLKPSDTTLFRNPLLMDRKSSVLLIVDVQDKLFSQIQNDSRILWNMERLVSAAKILGVETDAPEQYPAGLGSTVEPLKSMLANVAEKRMFSCRECSTMIEGWMGSGLRQVIVAGIEAHVCVLQTALDLQSAGFDIFVPADAVGSRTELDCAVALQRMGQAGISITTTESVLFEWCETSEAAEFKQISQLVRQSSPP